MPTARTPGPTLGDATRAAATPSDLDLGMLFQFGATGRGEQRLKSDLDLCLVFNDFGN